MAAAPRTVAVAFSGGRDSLALLHATAVAARSLGLEVVALHVHHGLVAGADAWVASAARLCRRWRRRSLPVRLCWQRLTGRPQPGDSVEAWARRERYAALAVMAKEQGATLVLLAHHRRDQAETVLLQALRGAGPRGLAAMPARIERGGLTWSRPWLEHRREAIDAYCMRHRLRPLEDPSNADERLARNRLRACVWPALTEAFPEAETALAAVARRAQEADAVLAEVARQDLAAVAVSSVPSGSSEVSGSSDSAVSSDFSGSSGSSVSSSSSGSSVSSALQVAPWRALSPARRANALRAWLAERHPGGVPQTLVQRLLSELPASRAGRWPFAVDAELVLYRGALSVAFTATAITGPLQPIDLSSPGVVEVAAWNGVFEVRPVREHGIEPARLAGVELRPRLGGERFARAPAGLPQSLKKQFQAAGVPAHDRGGPLVWRGEELLYVPGLGIDARRWAARGVPQLALTWRAARAGQD